MFQRKLFFTINTQKSTYLVCSIEQINKWLDASTLADGELVSRDLSKLCQGPHNINEHLFRLTSEQIHQGLQGFVLLKALDEEVEERITSQ